MLRCLVACLLLPLAALAADPVITAADLPAPAGAAGASGSSLAVAPDGVVWMTWLEPAGTETALRFATFDAERQRWSEARTIAQGAGWFVNWADFPALTVGPAGRATAVWFVNNPAPPGGAGAGHDHHGPGYRAFVSSTADAGATWSAARPLTRESNSVEFVSLATLADGRVLAAWLDGRAKAAGSRFQQLYSRILGGSDPDLLVDGSVCDCCQTTLTTFPDGTALLAYRGRTADEMRDIRLTRFRGGAWEAPRPLHADGWTFNACPVNGPQLASTGGRVAAAWFTAAGEDPRVLATFSADAGNRFLQPLRLTETKPAGRVATVLLRDTALLISWVDAAGALWLRRISPDFTAADAIRLSDPERGRVRGFPRVALVRDYLGGAEPARLLVSYTADAPPSLRTLVVTIPESELVRIELNCDCTPTAEELRGEPIRGVVADALPGTNRLRVRLFGVPGYFEEGVREFGATAEVKDAAGPVGGHFLGRFERRDGDWWLISARRITTPPR